MTDAKRLTPLQQKMVSDNRDFAHRIAAKLKRRLPKHLDLDDLKGYAEQGLIESVLAFDPTQGALFTTFAHDRIRGSIFDGLGAMTGLTRAQRRKIAEIERLETVMREEANAVGHMPTAGEAAESVRRLAQKVVSIMALSQFGEESQPGEPSNREDTADELAARNEMVQTMQVTIADFDAVDREIVRLLYTEGFSMSQAGNAVGLDKSNVHRRHVHILERLRKSLGVRATGKSA